LHSRRAKRSLALRHPYETSLRERLQWPLAESTQTSHRPASPGNDDLAPALDPLQVLAKSIVQLANTHFALRLM